MNDKNVKSLSHFSKAFLLWTVVLQIIVWQFHQTPILANAFQNSLADIVGNFYRIISNNIIVDNNLLIHPDTGRYVVVDSQCTGLSLVATLLAGIFSLFHSIKNKLLMAVSAIILIQFENIIRITHLFYEIKEPVNNFEIYHLYIWQLVNFLFALTVFYFLNHYVNKKEKSLVNNNNKKQIKPD
ncbi:MAG: archaeosortase/exosortase family protein [Colwellia sp.]|nr:archaeosortase/exosortase family protein [Colwellia sp.]